MCEFLTCVPSVKLPAATKSVSPSACSTCHEPSALATPATNRAQQVTNGNDDLILVADVRLS